MFYAVFPNFFENVVNSYGARDKAIERFRSETMEHMYLEKVIDTFYRLIYYYKGREEVFRLRVWAMLGLSEHELPDPCDLYSYPSFSMLEKVVSYMSDITGLGRLEKPWNTDDSFIKGNDVLDSVSSEKVKEIVKELNNNFNVGQVTSNLTQSGEKKFLEILPFEKFQLFSFAEKRFFLDIWLSQWFLFIPDSFFLVLDLELKKFYVGRLGNICSRAKQINVFTTYVLNEKRKESIVLAILGNSSAEFFREVDRQLYEPYLRGLKLEHIFSDKFLSKVDGLSSEVIRTVIYLFADDGISTSIAFLRELKKVFYFLSADNRAKLAQMFYDYTNEVSLSEREKILSWMSHYQELKREM